MSARSSVSAQRASVLKRRLFETLKHARAAGVISAPTTSAGRGTRVRELLEYRCLHASRMVCRPCQHCNAGKMLRATSGWAIVQLARRRELGGDASIAD